MPTIPAHGSPRAICCLPAGERAAHRDCQARYIRGRDNDVFAREAAAQPVHCAHPTMTAPDPILPPAGDLPAAPCPDPATSALFLDIDGTLLEFAERPDAVAVDASLPPLLRRLSDLFDGALAPISGRPLHEIDALLDLPRGAAAGLHGAQLRRADGVVIGTVPDPRALHALRRSATASLAGVYGVLVEAKPGALALHYRGAPSAAAMVCDVAERLAREAGAAYTLQPGNHVIELKPAGTDKGTAVGRLMRDAPFAGRAPWVLGDDLTDEHAFAVANALGGASVVVGPRRPTAARFALGDPRAAHAWLHRLAAGAARMRSARA